MWKIPSQVCHYSHFSILKCTLFGKSDEEKLVPKSHGNHPKVGLYRQNFYKSAQVVKKEYLKFFDILDQNQQSFCSFTPSQDRVDTLLSTTMRSYKYCTNLSDLVKMFLILYHGQSAIEGSFSIKKPLLSENLKIKSLVALRRIEDHMRHSQ